MTSDEHQNHIQGWVSKIRKLGELIFIDLRTYNGIFQLVIKSKYLEVYEQAKTLNREDLISVKGEIKKRKKINDKIKNGDLEMIVENLKIISKSQQTPLIIEDITDALEQVRMEYRYLDLRRPVNNEMLIFRSNFNRIAREFFYKLDFKEIETPLITRKTFSGADELKIISKNHPNKEYVLAQSPQIYKQLLMYSGIDKYFQIVKCFRDEDARKDRQLEFTQLDLEIAFHDQEFLFKLIEDLLSELFKNLLNVNIKKPFLRMTYLEALKNYGSDKPDLRFENTILDFTQIFKSGSSIIFNDFLNKKNSSVKAVMFENKISDEFFSKYNEIIKSESKFGLGSFYFNKNDDEVKMNHRLSEDIYSVFLRNYKKPEYTILYVIDEEEKALEIISRLRIEAAKYLNIIDENKFVFSWITDWPLFSLDDNKLTFSHNPFTKPSNIDKLVEIYNNKNKNSKMEELLNLKSLGYDLVLNGVEIGGGGVRINNRKIQEIVFELAGFKKELLKKEFDWFLRSQDYGIPEHLGIALGIDRILSIMLKKETIRDVIAFPKSSKGTDEMTKAPTTIS